MLKFGIKRFHGAIPVCLDDGIDDLNGMIAHFHTQPRLAAGENTFRREFKRQMGMGAVRYINGEKIKKARHVLRHEHMTVGEISEALGFYDEAHFCRVFKTFTGLTPAQYREHRSADSTQTKV